jgi:hypothetical protein
MDLFFWVSCANLQKFQSCNLCSAQEKRTQNKPIFFKNQALVCEEQASKQASILKRIGFDWKWALRITVQK